ncbi:MAG TPA: heme-binding protein [Xanthobacteraceae bacterium]|jgi:uncharacterized protein GlcG (DUF336 family)|nr:heme-binding protein [Xanthobacteraceae bacterium]
MIKAANPVLGLSLACAFACAASTGANAQLLTHKDISVAMAIAMAKTAIETCKGQGYNVSVHVVDRDGQVILGLRNDLAGPATMENSLKKAYTARTFRRPSGEFAKGVQGNPVAGALMLTNIVAAQGALPIKVGDDVIGAIGVSGAPGGDKDEACAKAGIDKVAADLK